MTEAQVADESRSVPPLLPARILNEHVYCPRLAYLEWVDQLFEDNAETAEGAFTHRTVDRERGRPPDPSEDWERPASTAVTLSSERLGLIARVDLLEPRGASVVPIEYKRGRPRSGDEPLWEPELVQLAAQVLLLREAGYRVGYAEVYFGETHTRHRIEITGELADKTTAAAREVRENASRSGPPPPLVDSPKCPRCSLVNICLPDEVNALRFHDGSPVRRLIAPHSQAQPLYAMTPGSRLSKRGGRVVLFEDGEQSTSRRMLDVSQISVFGNVDVSSALLRDCFDRGAHVMWFTSGGWFAGMATGVPPKNIQVRIRQYRAAALGSPEIAAACVAGKIRNQRTLIRRHGGVDAHKSVAQLAALGRKAEVENDLAALLGIEGTAARIYFGELSKLIRPPEGDFAAFDFVARNRRPPTDPVNALLSFTYALLVKDATAACFATGLDPFLGVYHRPRFGRPALALDLAEEFRPLVADSVVLTAINNGEVRAASFLRRAGSVALTTSGRRAVIRGYERRMTSELRHPLFRYKASYRRMLEVQARLMASVFIGELPAYRPLTTR